MDSQKIRQAYLDFFKERGHAIIKRAKLVPENDPTTLFTGSGMQPLLPYLLGETHPNGARLTNSQACFRSQDIDDIGDNRHTTFFEMLGNWSLGDYSKEQQIRWFFEFLTDKVGLDPNNLYVSVFIGDESHGIPRDDEAANIWQQVFKEKGVTAKIAEIGSAKNGDERGVLEDEHIFFYDDKENWWSRNGGISSTPIGDPCGPDSEVFYDFGEDHHDDSFGLAHPASDSGRFVEIGNQVFMQYRRNEDGSFSPLAKQNIDFGGGLERISAAALGVPDVFQISLIKPIIEKLEQISGKEYAANKSSMRVIADHLRAAVFLAVDGVVPSNKAQGYVMRRLIRRAIRFALDLGVEQNFIEEIVLVIANLYEQDYPEILDKKAEIVAVLNKEEKAFRQTLKKGLNEFSKIFRNKALMKEMKSGDSVDYSASLLNGKDIFVLYDTYGFPVELTLEEAYRLNWGCTDNWRDEFDAKMAEQRLRSQTATKGVFKGGLEGQTEMQIKYHTAAHLLAQALRNVLGESVAQRGSNINDERIRFDFSWGEKMTSEQIQAVEDQINQKITEDLDVTFGEYPVEEAFKMGAHGEFSDKYGDKVKVYKIFKGDEVYSLEICGGPHVNHTGELAEGGKKFKILKEESSSAGVRRIKAVLI